MLDNCFRFAPRDSIPGLIAKICKYLKDHPGWSEEELEDQIKKFISETGVESFNGRTGTVTLDKNDVNNLKIASAYFAEGEESIDSLDLVSLYNQGVRFVFTDFNSVTSGYNLAFVLDYFSGSGDVVYYPMSTGSGSGGNIVSVNGKTGVVELSLADIVGTSGVQVKLCTATEFASTNTATWNAYYNEGYRIVGVVNSDTTAIDHIYLLKQDKNNHAPIGISTGASDAYTPNNPPPYPVKSVNGKTGAVTGLYGAENPPPYPVTSVNGKTGTVTGLYDAENPPPYPVTSVNGKTGAVTGLYDAENPPPYPVTSVNGKTGNVTGLYDAENQPPYPITSFNGLTGAINYNPITLISGRTVDNHSEYEVPPHMMAICANIFITENSTLPAGNTMHGTIKWSGASFLNEMLMIVPKTTITLDGFYDVQEYQCKMLLTNRTNLVAGLRYGIDAFIFNYTNSTITVNFYDY